MTYPRSRYGMRPDSCPSNASLPNGKDLRACHGPHIGHFKLNFKFVFAFPTLFLFCCSFSLAFWERS